MSKNLHSIKFAGGVSRIENSDLNRPYQLENAEVKPRGFVRAVNDPTEYTAITNETKPYVEWNGEILDRNSYSADEGSDQISATALADAKMNARLYRSVKATDNESNDNYRVVKFYSDWSSSTPTENWQGEPAIVYDSSFSLQDLTEYSFVTSANDPDGNVEQDIHTGYLAIPYDKNGERGNFFHFTVLRQIYEIATSTVNIATPADITLLCNDNVEYVEIYRTMDMNNRGFVHTGPKELPIITSTASISIDQLSDHGYYYYDSFRSATNNSSGIREINFRDSVVWMTATMFEVLKDDLTIDDGRTEIIWRLLDAEPYNNLNNKITVPTQLLQIGRNFHSIHEDIVGSDPYQYHGVGANVMSAQSGIILYGDVYVPTKRPTTGLVMHKEQTPYANIQAQLEYVDNDGNVYYGPKETFAAVESIKFAWQGESALLIFIGGNLFERLTPNAEGMYTTGFKRISTDDEGFQAPVSYIVNSDNGSTTFDEDSSATVVDYYQEPNAVFLSATNRGMEVTFDSFYLKSDETIRAIMSARLAEEESIRDYDFYVFTDKSITLYKRTGEDLRDIVPVHNVTNTLGVAQTNFTALTGTDPTRINLVAPTRFGVAFIGTDNRVYHLVGRELQQLDIEIPGLFSGYTGFHDIAYHGNLDQLWFILDLSSIWVYDFTQGGWTKNINPIHVPHVLYYHEGEGIMHSWGRIDGIEKTFKFDENDDNINTLAEIITQPIESGGKELQIVEMQIDYEVEDYTVTSKDNWAYIRHSIRSPNILGIEESSSSTKHKVQYYVPANRPFYPTLVGRGHQIKIARFQELRDIEIKVIETNS